MANVRIGESRGTPGLVAHGDDVKVMIADDQEVFRRVLRELILATKGFALVGEVASGDDVLLAMPEVMADFVVMDARMSGTSGVEAAAALLRRYPDRVVLLTSVDDLAGRMPTGPSGKTIPFVCKRDLRRKVLLEVWEEHRPASDP